MPIEVGSGVDRAGKARPAKRYVMCRRGNDLVRRYLWMAALSAVRFNPAVRALYARVVAKHPDRKAVAIGHAMRKLLHLVFAVWKTNKPFDKNHYPWDTPAHVEANNVPNGTPSVGNRIDMGAAQAHAAGHKNPDVPERKVVTAACAPRVPHDSTRAVDFAHVKTQLPITRVLEHLGLASKLRGPGAQKRCACPIHRADGRGRTFSVNLDENVFQCFDAQCQKKGDVIDLWAALHHLDLRQAALDLMQTFALEPTPRTEQMHG